MVDMVKDDSPFPSHSDMDLDMWKAQSVNPDKSRYIEGVAGSYICAVYGNAAADPQRDSTTRRIEMIGDLYEALRIATEKLAKAGLNTDQESVVLGDFVAPKPFREGH